MKFSKIISFVFHPIFMPTYAIFLLFAFFPLFSDFMSMSQKKQIIKLIIIFTFLLPVFSVLILKKFKVITSIYMKKREERRWPLLFAIGWYYILLRLFDTIHTHHIIIQLLLGAIFILLLATIVSNFWKISLHMLAIGGVTGAFFAIYFLFGGEISLIIILLFFAGLVGFARISEMAHDFKQVYLGFLIGTVTEFLIFLF